MNFLFVLLASVFISLAWLIPIHYHPWVTYTGELYAFFALITLAALLVKEKVHIPKLTLGLVVLAIVPLGQFFFGKVFFFSNAIMSSIYILGLWFAIIFGYNLSIGKFNRDGVMPGLTTYSFVTEKKNTFVLLTNSMPFNAQKNTIAFKNFIANKLLEYEK